MKRIWTYLAAVLMLVPGLAGAQVKFGDVVSIDEVSHDFGDILISDGAVSCTFTVTNISDKPVAILNVVSSCGCTDVNWTKAPLAAGKTGSISATYSNDEGPYPFEKTLTAYISGIKKPVILRLRGNSIQKKEALAVTYPVHLGNLGMKSTELKCGNLEQGSSQTEEVLVANIGKSPLKLDFTGVDPDLAIGVTQNPIPAGATAKLRFTVKANPDRWGKNTYLATPVVAGKKYAPISIWAVTKENFSGMTKEEKDNASRPMFASSTFSFGKVKAGTRIDFSYSVSNVGKTAFRVYSADADQAGLDAEKFPQVKAGGKATWNGSFDSTGLPKGETTIILTLITNSPNRPIVNLFLTGWIE